MAQAKAIATTIAGIIDEIEDAKLHEDDDLVFDLEMELDEALAREKGNA